MSHTVGVTTWTEVDRATRTTITLTVTDAPLYDGLPSIRVQPDTVVLWLTDHDLTRVGLQGDITAGPGARSGGHVAFNWAVTDPQCPEWLLNLAMDAL